MTDTSTDSTTETIQATDVGPLTTIAVHDTTGSSQDNTSVKTAFSPPAKGATTVFVTFMSTDGVHTHTRSVNAVFAADGTYDAAATQTRVASVALGVANKFAVGALTVDPSTLAPVVEKTAPEAVTEPVTEETPPTATTETSPAESVETAASPTSEAPVAETGSPEQTPAAS